MYWLASTAIRLRNESGNIYIVIESGLHWMLNKYYTTKPHRTTESNTLQGYTISVIDSERAY